MLNLQHEVQQPSQSGVRKPHQNRVSGGTASDHGAQDAFSKDLDQKATNLAVSLPLNIDTHSGRSLLNSDGYTAGIA